ncbi:hypothetical protein Barb6_02268 [Bacteroidales bacterium Barb6]|nr:hypothetical protein Barb6_02268 [Bacteroidales bacterium Barb6]
MFILRFFTDTVTALLRLIPDTVMTGYFLRFPDQRFIQIVWNVNRTAKTATGATVKVDA